MIRISLTRKRSLVQTQYRPPAMYAVRMACYRIFGNGPFWLVAATLGAFWEHGCSPGVTTSVNRLSCSPGEHHLVPQVVTPATVTAATPAAVVKWSAPTASVVHRRGAVRRWR